MNSLDQSITRAFDLAYFIHGDKAAALRIAAEATAKLELAAAAQDKRLYYTPKADRHRSKVSASQAHLMQRLVYAESELYERETERRFLTSNPGDDHAEEAMIIHFIKHLVRITARRNSFYVTLGVSRLLHQYSTAETMELYNVVVQDPDRVRDDYYYRSRKKQLMQEMKDRFGEMLQISRGARGEDRFLTDDCPNGHADLVRDCLRRFTPWDTRCALPAKFDPFTDAIPALAFDGRDPDAEHGIEASRFHAVLDPACFERLAAGLNLPAPAAHLAVPHFAIAKREDDDNAPRPPRSRRPRESAELEGGELDAIKRQLAAESSRRKRFTAAALRVLVDGSERARFDPARTSLVEFQVEEGSELIEVRAAADGDLLLATHLIGDWGGQASKETAIVLEGGQKISFRVSPIVDARGETSCAGIEVAYREMQWSRAAALALRKWMAGVDAPFPPVMKPALAFALLAVFAIVFGLLWRSPKSPSPRDIAGASPTPTPQLAQPSPTVAPVRRGSRDRSPESQPQAPPKPLLAHEPDRPQPLAPDEPPMPDVQPDETSGLRSGGKRQEPVSLARVKTVHVDPFSPAETGQPLREAVATALGTIPNLRVSATRDDADAVLKGTIAVSNARMTLRARMVHASGAVVWPANRQWKEYKGSAAEIARKLAIDVRGDLEKGRRK
jgi:hypothetical protein